MVSRAATERVALNPSNTEKCGSQKSGYPRNQNNVLFGWIKCDGSSCSISKALDLMSSKGFELTN